jgi:hypothetical protein
MNKKKIIIAILVIFVVLAAAVALASKLRVKSGEQTIAKLNPETNLAPDKISSSTEIAAQTASQTAEALTGNSIQVSGPTLNALPGSPEAPKQIEVKTSEIPAQAVKIDITATGFSPKEFRVKEGAAITLALSASDGQTHVFIFPDASLMGLTTMVLGGSIKTLTFNAPKAGSYSFRDDIPQFRANSGVMIVE